jgi:hypothetical protein
VSITEASSVQRISRSLSFLEETLAFNSEEDSMFGVPLPKLVQGGYMYRSYFAPGDNRSGNMRFIDIVPSHTRSDKDLHLT